MGARQPQRFMQSGSGFANAEVNCVRHAPLSRAEFVQSVRELSKLAPAYFPGFEAAGSLVGPQAAALGSTDFGMKHGTDSKTARKETKESRIYRACQKSMSLGRKIKLFRNTNLFLKNNESHRERDFSSRNATDQLRALNATSGSSARNLQNPERLFSPLYLRRHLSAVD